MTGQPTDDDWRALEWEIQDLFSPAAPINEASLIAGRQSQINKLIDAVFERGRHAVLLGEKGVGKTSLANTFHMMFSTGLKTVSSIRKPAFPYDDFTSLWRRVFSDIFFDGSPVSEKYTAQITPDDVVRELSNFSLNTLPIIILDEFDKLSNIDAKKLISHTIKAVSDDKSANATIIIVGVAEDVTLLVEEHGSISRNIVEIPMPRMDRDEMNEIIDQRYPKVGVGIDPKARESILSLARGLPEYVHFLARDAAKHAVRGRRKSVQRDDVGTAIRSMTDSSDRTSRDAYEKAVMSNKKNNLYRQVLLACALVEPDEMGRFTASDVTAPLTKILGREIRIPNFFPHIEAFCTEDRGCILEKKGSRQAYKYRFKEPKMQPYVMMRGVQDKIIPPERILTP